MIALLLAALDASASSAYVAKFQCSTQARLNSEAYDGVEGQTLMIDSWTTGSPVHGDSVVQSAHVADVGKLLGIAIGGDGRRRIDLSLSGGSISLLLGSRATDDATYYGRTALADGSGTVETTGQCAVQMNQPPPAPAEGTQP